MSLLSPQTASRLSRDNVSYHLTQSPSALSRARALFIRNYSPQFGTSRLKKITNRPIRAYLDGLLEPPFHSLPNNALLRFISTSNSVIRVPPPCRGRANMTKEGKEKNLPSRHIVFQPSNRRRWKNQTPISPQTPDTGICDIGRYQYSKARGEREVVYSTVSTWCDRPQSPWRARWWSGGRWFLEGERGIDSAILGCVPSRLSIFTDRL